MGRRVLPAALVVAAVIADTQGAHGVARDALLAALPFASVAALVAFGDYVERRIVGGGVQALCSGVIVGLMVLSCALRSNAVHGLPPLASSSLLAALGLIGLKLALGALPHARRLGSLSPAKP